MATIQYHLNKNKSITATILKDSFYCDNCITSVDSVEEMNIFIEEAKNLMLQGGFELRCWVTGPTITDETIETISVLGLIWDPYTDQLFCKLPCFNTTDIITKRTLLSLAQSIFDPIGLTAPCTLIPKMLMQKCWKSDIKWDEEVTPEVEKEIKEWIRHLNNLSQCRIPRRLNKGHIDSAINSLHVFCDASQNAYSSCIFLRSVYNNHVSVQLVLARSRVTPVKNITMPRLELIAAVLATRLASEVKCSLNLKNCQEFYWTDSSIVLAWIQKQAGLNVFVHNRVKEITEKTNIENWRHIAGSLNPADLPSRGCHAQALLKSRWWEGPPWLKENMSRWPLSKPEPDLTEVNREIKVDCKTTTLTVQNSELFSNRLNYFSKYTKMVRMIAWCIRFTKNCRKKLNRKSGILSAEDYEYAEKTIFSLIQEEFYSDLSKTKRILNLELYKGDDNILRVKTRLTLREDDKSFIFPILLPSSHNIVKKLIQHKHAILCHAGSQTLINSIREEYWIVGIRRLAKKIVRECVVCRRHSAQRCLVAPGPLPTGRIKCVAAFSTTGLDFGGPFILRSGEKCWLALFTCATYRAVHLELCLSLSTEDFLLSLRRFIARKGRPNAIYSDNGTNFQGANNLLKSIDWNQVEHKTSCEKIHWYFLPPQSPWWGGFYERMIKTVKEMLRRILGKASLNYIMLYTLLCEVESVVNRRPLTYISDSTENVMPLTPSMFLHDAKSYCTADFDWIDDQSLNASLKYLQKLRQDFKTRFRSEYLSLLIQRYANKKESILKPGDVVLIELQDAKRCNWPLGVVIEIFDGVDGHGRVARVRTAVGERIRPLQRLFPLEVSSRDFPNATVQDATTRSGRKVKVPCRLNL